MEIRRLLCFTALLFSVVIITRYFERPYGYLLSSLVYFGQNDLKSKTDHIPLNGSSGAKNDLQDNNYLSGGFTDINQNSTVERVVRNKSSEPEMALSNDRNSTSGNLHDTNEDKISPLTSLQVAVPPSNSHSPEYMAKNGSDNVISILFNSSSMKRFEGQPAVVVPISAMNDMFHQSRILYQSKKPKWPSQVDEELVNTRRLIEVAQIMEKNASIDVNVYRNYSEFIRSYELMEQTLKIYIYTEGERPVFHRPKLFGTYASEGWFMKQLEENNDFVTTNPYKAHLFYLPFSSRMLMSTLYIPKTNSLTNLVEYLSRYVLNITTTYNFWNRTDGADHFLVACHDWAPAETNEVMKNCIRALCNAEVKLGFEFGKDVSLPIFKVRNVTNPLKGLGGKPCSQRSTLAFFAGNVKHGYLRPILLSYWGNNKDPDMKIFGKRHDVKGEMTYTEYMKSSKYCISARGYGPFTPRVVEAIFYECVPVIISDNYVPPLFETLNWESFAVFVLEKDIPNLKDILLSISEQRYLEMQERVRQVQKHFLWHNKPVKHDVFHMILHSIWNTRVYQTRSW